MIRIMLVRQLESQLLPGEILALTKALKESAPTYITTNPQNQKEHLNDCVKHKPTFVLLPFPIDQTIPRSAMREEFRHIIVSAGEVRELDRLKPKTSPTFKTFVR